MDEPKKSNSDEIILIINDLQDSLIQYLILKSSNPYILKSTKVNEALQEFISLCDDLYTLHITGMKLLPTSTEMSKLNSQWQKQALRYNKFSEGQNKDLLENITAKTESVKKQLAVFEAKLKLTKAGLNKTEVKLRELSFEAKSFNKVKPSSAEEQKNITVPNDVLYLAKFQGIDLKEFKGSLSNKVMREWREEIDV